MSSAARAFACAPADLFAGALHGGEHGGATIDLVKRGGKRDDAGFAVVPGNGAHGLAKLLGIDVEAWQSGDAKQAHIVAGGYDRVQAGKQVARFGSVGDVHALDDERDIGLGQLMDDLVAMKVRAVEDAEVGPFASGFSLRVANGADQVGALGVSAGENDHLHRAAENRRARFCGFLFARRLERHTPVSRLPRERRIQADSCR